MSRYAVSGRNELSGSSANVSVGAVLWNPHASISLFVSALSFFTGSAAVADIGITRSSSRGTPVASITPDLDNDFARRIAPISGAVIDHNFGANNPTLVTTSPYLAIGYCVAVIYSGFSFVFNKPIEVPAGTGLALVTQVASVIPAGNVTFVWDE